MPLPVTPAGVLGRVAHSAVWTQREMIVWGGFSARGSLRDGAAYDPQRNEWRVLSKAPLAPREGHVAAWTGTRMIVWGGTSTFEGSFYADGASYDPETDSWALLPPAPAGFRGRQGAISAWSTTTDELIVWGGSTADVEAAEDGAAYAPAKKTWRSIAKSMVEGRSGGAPIWNGTKLIFYGGSQCASSIALYCVDGAMYEPVDDRWTTTPPAPKSAFNGPDGHAGVATGKGNALAAFWGGEQSGVSPAVYASTGAAYDDATATWRSIEQPEASALARAPRGRMVAFSANDRFFVWGGVDATSVLANGASYDFASGSWTPMADGGPSARSDATVVYTGTSAIIWGGSAADIGVYYDDGALYVP